MSDVEESPGPVRKTRSGRAVKTPSKAKATPAKSAGRKTRKKVVVMEVEVTDDEETEQAETSEPVEKKLRLDEEKLLEASDNEGTDDNCKSEDALLNSGDEADKKNNSSELVMNDIAMLEEIIHINEKITEKVQESEIESKNGNTETEKVIIINKDEKEKNKNNAEERTINSTAQKEETGTMDPLAKQEDTIIPPPVEEEKMENGVPQEKDGEQRVSKEKLVTEDKQFEEKEDENETPKVKETKEESKEIFEEIKDDAKENISQKVETLEFDKAGDFKNEAEEKKEDPKAEGKKEQVTNQNGEPEAENISDDELPGVPVAKVPETEEVSDEELPGPKRAELPADTEVVSEDELPTTKKEADEEEAVSPTKKESSKRKLSEGGYDPTSPTSETEAPSKKTKEDKEEKEKEGAEAAKSAKPKKLPELDKYWKAVNDDPTDFTGWTYLLQYVDQENDMEAAREAYDAFLSHYPYCYGYWRKYADYEKRKGNKKKCEEVFERGLKAIPLSVDLWIHYLTYVKTARGEEEEYVRSQFERALLACGLEFRSDRLWDSYIKWETDGKRLQKVTAIFDRLLTTPTQGYTTHFDNFQEHISSNTPNTILEVDEFLALRKEVRSILKNDEKAAENADLPPGDEDSKLYTSEEESKGIRERIVSIRRKIHKNTVNAVTSRWNFEEGIKRPYFHVKPLERCQLKNWQEYLDFEIEQGDRTRIIVLFERCLIACALYEEFWLKFVHYLESVKDDELHPKIRDVYERACTIHHLKKPNLHLQWAVFEEALNNMNRAAEILVNLEKQVPNVLQVAYRRINLERRRGDFEKCSQLFEHYIGNSKNKMISSNIAIKYSRFCLKVVKDFDKAQETLKTAISKDPNNPRLYLQLIDLTLQKENVKEEDICAIIEEFLEKESADPDQKALFAQRKLEYLEDFGSSVQTVQGAYEQYQKYQKLGKEASKKKENKAESTTSSSSKKEKAPPASSTAQSQSYSNYNYGSSSNQPPYNYSGSQQGQYSYPQYGQGDQQYQYQNWQYPQGGAYGGYNQWGGYTGGYSY